MGPLGNHVLSCPPRRSEPLDSQPESSLGTVKDFKTSDISRTQVLNSSLIFYLNDDHSNSHISVNKYSSTMLSDQITSVTTNYDF